MKPPGSSVAWRGDYCYVTSQWRGTTTTLRIDPDTGEMVDVSGDKVVASDVHIAVDALRYQESPRYLLVANRLRTWWDNRTA